MSLGVGWGSNHTLLFNKSYEQSNFIGIGWKFPSLKETSFEMVEVDFLFHLNYTGNVKGNVELYPTRKSHFNYLTFFEIHDIETKKPDM